MVYVSITRLLCFLVIFVKFKDIFGEAARKTNKFIVIRKSSVFVDKTVLLKKIFEYDFLLLTAPQKFGKSTNMQMIKLFLGNNNLKVNVANVFRNTNIWRDREFIVKHVCNHPIVYCSFKPKTAVQTFIDVSNQLKMSIRDAFVEHKYLLKSPKIGIASKQLYMQYCRLQVKDFEVGLKFLSQTLHTHHGKKVTVLIDDYDYFITYSIFKKELDSTKIAQLVFRMVDNTINLNEFVERAVVMGGLPFKLGVQFSGLYLLEHFKFMETKDFTPYFGFTQRETGNLLGKFGLGNLIKNVSLWYGGYSYLHSDFYIYNPWSVLMFIKTRDFNVHWVSPKSRQMLLNYIEPHYELKELIAKLVNHENVTIQAVASFTSFEVEKLKNAPFATLSYADDSVEDHLFLQVLLESGYLTYAETYRVLPISTKVKFPNMEINKVFQQVLMRLAAVYPDINRY